MRNKEVHTLVVGSGLAGLSCARMLANEGHSVTVLEKAQALGGHLIAFNRGGAHFEVGIHYIADTGPGSQWDRSCKALGVNFEIVPLDDAFDELRFPGHSPLGIEGPIERFVAELLRRFPDEREAIEQYAETARAVIAFSDWLELPYDEPDELSVLMRHPRALKVAPLAGQSLDHYLRKTLGVSPGLYEILAFHHVLIGVPPKRLSALIYFAVNGYYFRGAAFVRGGGNAMIEELLDERVDYRTRADARFSRIEDGKAGVLCEKGRAFPLRFRAELPDGEILAHNVVWTPDPRLIERSASFRLDPLTRFRLSRVEDPHAYVVGYFATREPLSDYGLENRNYWLMGDLRSNEMYRTRDLQRLAAGAPIYMSTGSLRDPGAIEPDSKIGARGVFQAMFLCPPDPELWGGSDLARYRKSRAKGGFKEDYTAIKDRMLEQLKERVFAEFPQLEGELVWDELGSPLTHGRYLNSIGLNGLGYSPTVFDATIGRPGYRTGVPGLYLCGQYIKPAHGIATALANGTGLGRKLARQQMKARPVGGVRPRVLM